MKFCWHDFTEINSTVELTSKDWEKYKGYLIHMKDVYGDVICVKCGKIVRRYTDRCYKHINKQKAREQKRDEWLQKIKESEGNAVLAVPKSKGDEG